MVTRTTKIVLISVGVAIIVIIAVVVPLVIFLKKDDESTKYPDDSDESNNSTTKGCSIYPFEVDPHPLIVLANTSTFLYPKWGESILRFAVNQQVDFICPGRTIHLGSLETTNSLLTGTCIEGNLFKINEDTVDWSQMRCNTSLWRDIRATGYSCPWHADEQEIEAGYSVEDGRFLRTLLICFNPALQIADNTYIEQTASITKQVLGTARPSWLQGSGIYSIGTVTSLYLRNNQKATINRLLGLPDNATKYIQDTGDFFLARGHLTARSDGYYAAQQNATFFMQNIAPQWQTFNGNNWRQVEMDVRNYSAINGVDLQVWTGVHGVTDLPHEITGQPTELYLFVNATSKLLPVPEVFWKLVYNPKTERGVALIGVNNPYKSEFSPICPDISEHIEWLHCNKTNQVEGFCYACNITSLGWVVSRLPKLTDGGPRRKVAVVFCRIVPLKGSSLYPFVLYPGQDKFIYPDRAFPENKFTILTFKSGTKLDFVCPSAHFTIDKSKSILTGTCLFRQKFRIDNYNKTFKWDQLECNNKPRITLRPTKKKCARNKGTELEAGFEVADARFLRILLICFNKKLNIAFYSYITQLTCIPLRFDDKPPWYPPSEQSEIYNVKNISQYYVVEVQRETVNKLVGLPPESGEYVKDYNSGHFWARGQLIDDDDLFYPTQKTATFVVENAAPQWYQYKRFNWDYIGINVRTLMRLTGHNLEVYSGVYGNAILPKYNTTYKRNVKLFLYANSTTRSLPIPEFFWKVVYDPQLKIAVALIDNNNPFVERFTGICTDVTSYVDWLHCQRNRYENGYCYACTYPDFKKVVNVLPHLELNETDNLLSKELLYEYLK